jgi:hypothetical protein
VVNAFRLRALSCEIHECTNRAYRFYGNGCDIAALGGLADQRIGGTAPYYRFREKLRIVGHTDGETVIPGEPKLSAGGSRRLSKYRKIRDNRGFEIYGILL